MALLNVSVTASGASVTVAPSSGDDPTRTSWAAAGDAPGPPMASPASIAAATAVANLRTSPPDRRCPETEAGCADHDAADADAASEIVRRADVAGRGLVIVAMPTAGAGCLVCLDDGQRRCRPRGLVVGGLHVPPDDLAVVVGLDGREQVRAGLGQRPDGDGELVELLRPDADAVVGGPRHRRDGLLERVVTNLDRFGKLFGGEFGRPAGMRLDANGRERRVRGEVQAYGGGPGGVGFVRYPDGDLGPRARGVGVRVDGDMSGSGCRGGHGDDGDAARGEPDARERTRKHGHEKSLTHDDESARPSRRAAFGPQRWVSSA